MAARAKKSPDDADPGFEERLLALEAIVRDLEGEGLTLEQSLARYQQGVSHVNACRALLDAAEQRLVELVEAPGGGVRERPLKVGEQGLTTDDDGDDGDAQHADGDEDGDRPR